MLLLLSPRLYLALTQHIWPVTGAGECALAGFGGGWEGGGETEAPSVGYRPSHTVMCKDKHIAAAQYAGRRGG